LHKALAQTRRILFAVSVTFFIAFLIITLFRTSLQTIDIQVNLWTPTIRNPILTALALGIAETFETNSLVLISTVISGLLFLKNRKHLGLLLFGIIGGDALLVTILKVTCHVARPTNGVYATAGFSYPSGHSAAVVVFIGILAYFMLRRYYSTMVKVTVGTSIGILVGVVGFDRVYLNVHWFSDVLGGWLFGAFWLTFAVSMFVWLESKRKFCSARFNTVANWLYVVAFAISFLIIGSDFIV
jgi:undecaprenyl-diphosphatase